MRDRSGTRLLNDRLPIRSNKTSFHAHRGAGHGAREEFLVEIFAREHPIMKGLREKWMHTQDELYHGLRGSAKELSVLGSGRPGS